jgi:hypothetical protein
MLFMTVKDLPIAYIVNHAPLLKPQPSSATKSFLERLSFGLLEIGHSRKLQSSRTADFDMLPKMCMARFPQWSLEQQAN